MPRMRIPEKGYYYHYKHSPESFDNMSYEVLGVARHTEDDTYVVVYRALYYEAREWKAGGLFDVRPLAMFLEEVTKDGKTFPRFSRITDPELIAKLEARKREMYGV
jgi:hypothetical protein